MRRTLLLVPRAVRTLETFRPTMEPPKKTQRKQKSSPEQLMNQKAKEASQKQIMERLEGELQDIISSNIASETIMQGRTRVKDAVERALQEKFGSKVRVESIGLDRLGLPLGQAPLELAVVDPDSDPLKLPDLGNALYQPPALMDALRSSGIPVQTYSPPSWISSECAYRRFALPEPTIINAEMGLVLVPPDPSHAMRLSLVEEFIEKCPTMRNVLALVYIFAARDTDAILPPLNSRIFSYLTLAFYCHRYGTSVPNTASTPSPIISFYCLPSITVSPDGSNDMSSSVREPIKMSAFKASEFSPRKATSSTASDLLDLLKWWDQLRWDHHVILPTSPLPLLRSFDLSFDNVPDIKRTWDWRHSPLVLQDPVYPLNNLATLLSPTSYAEIRTSFRSIHRSLRAGLGTSLARKETQLLRDPLAITARSVSTVSGKNYGDHLTGDMLDLYKHTRPSEGVRRARQQTIDWLKRIINNRFGSEYVPVLFGSSRYGVSDNQSDLDIVVLDQERPYGFTPTTPDNSLPALYQLHNLAEHMRKKRYGKVIVIPAKVPIIKAKDPNTNLHIDININDRLGLFNTELLDHYCALWPPLSNLIYVVKKWAKSRGLNEPAGFKRSGPTFSSYCLTLMVIGFLQSHRVLPNLHDGIHSGNQQERPYFWIKVGKNSRMKCLVDWNRLPVESWRPVNNPSLGRAFYAWLHYFAYDHKYDEFAIRVAEGGVVPRRIKMKLPKSKPKSPSTNPALDQAMPSDAPEETNDTEPSVEVEAITDDIEPAELAAAADEARATLDADTELAETLVDDTFVRASCLEEPLIWGVQGLVVGDPFITSKNCAANVAKKSLMDFKNECKTSLEGIDAGMNLRWLLSGRHYSGVDEERQYEEAVAKRVNSPKPKKKKPHVAAENAPQTQRGQPQRIAVNPAVGNAPH